MSPTVLWWALGAGVVAAAIAVVLLALQGGEGERGGPPPIPVGFNNNAVGEGVASADQAADIIATAGGTVDRVQIRWATLEPRPGRYDFSVYDEIYEADLARGIRPLFGFAFAPEWANGGVCPDENLGCHAPPTPRHYRDAASTAGTIAERYPEAAGIEIWNEPNSPYFWAPAADPEAYTALLLACRAEIERVAPDMPVAGASLSSTPRTDPGYVAAAEFLRRMYATDAPRPMDAIAVHPYPDPADPDAGNVVELLAELETIRDRAGDAQTPFWVTETGLTTTGEFAVGETEQRDGLLAVYDLLLGLPAVEMVLVHTLVEPPRGFANPETGFGVVRPDLNPKPAFCGLLDRWGGPGSEGC